MMAFTNTVTLSLVRIWKRRKVILESVQMGQFRKPQWLLGEISCSTPHPARRSMMMMMMILMMMVMILMILIMMVMLPLVGEFHRWRFSCQSFQRCRRRELWRTPVTRLFMNGNHDDEEDIMMVIVMMRTVSMMMMMLMILLPKLGVKSTLANPKFWKCL